MTLEKIADITSTDDPAWAIYESSFPSDERRTFDAHRETMGNQQYQMFSVNEGDDVQGMLGVWNLGSFTFIEHFAVREDLRGQGIGTRTMEEFLAAKGMAVLEVEPDNEQGIKFWEKNGFELNSLSYLQPSYGEGKKPVPLSLMSRPDGLYGPGFDFVRREIHTKAYKLSEPLTEDNS